ncbi:MAG: hypothetical protein ACMVO5_01920 [Polymorphobacter sp.]|uniref:hypothetical protein n=1 Tax=Polymorphobacter sp. TaxID=1909290 RepID=UPI003A8AC0F7
MTKSDPTQSALVARWLCHDLASPIATLLTASELLGDQGDPEINSLITQAIRRLAARLKLVRLAMGSAAVMSAPPLEKLFAEALPDTSVTLDLPANAPSANVIAASVLILAELSRTTPISVTAKGAHWTDETPAAKALAAALSRVSDEPRGSMIALAAAQAKASGWTLAPHPAGLSFAQS